MRALEEFVRKCRESLMDNLVCILLSGSFARGEPIKGWSDLDLIIVLKEVNHVCLSALRKLWSEFNPRFPQKLLIYPVGLQELEGFPRGWRMQFLTAKPLYGGIEVEPPSKEDIQYYMQSLICDILSYSRHYYLFPHGTEKLVKQIYYLLKMCDWLLRDYLYYGTGKILKTRKEVVQDLEKEEDMSQGVKLLNVLSNWNHLVEEVEKNPLRFLLEIEEFARCMLTQVG